MKNQENTQDTTVLRPMQAAKALGVTTHTLNDWYKAGKLSAHRTAGGQLRIPSSEVDRLLGRNTLANSQGV